MIDYTSHDLAKVCLDVARRPTGHIDGAEATMREAIRSAFRDWMCIVKNIQDTSLNEEDRKMRIREFGSKFHLPIDHLL